MSEDVKKLEEIKRFLETFKKMEPITIVSEVFGCEIYTPPVGNHRGERPNIFVIDDLLDVVNHEMTSITYAELESTRLFKKLHKYHYNKDTFVEYKADCLYWTKGNDLLIFNSHTFKIELIFGEDILSEFITHHIPPNHGGHKMIVIDNDKVSIPFDLKVGFIPYGKTMMAYPLTTVTKLKLNILKWSRK